MVRRIALRCSSEARPLRLPYETRNPRLAAEALSRAALCTPGGRVKLLFLIPGLRPRIIGCSASSAWLEIGLAVARDELSGMRHEVPSARILVDDCVVELKWRRSRLVLTAEALVRCGKCREETPG